MIIRVFFLKMYLNVLCMQPGSFALVASILYKVDEQAYRNVFYNGTIEVVEGSGFVSGETIFLVTLGMGMLGLLGMWAYGQFTKISKVCYLYHAILMKTVQYWFFIYMSYAIR